MVGVVTGLRQEVLDARLSLERTKQVHKDELEQGKKKEVENEDKVKEAINQLNKSNEERDQIKTSCQEAQEKSDSIQ